jgi:hypothetical protein
VLPSDIESLLVLGFIEAANDKEQAKKTELDEHSQTYPNMTDQERYVEAAHLATALTSKLGLMGFRLNLAVESAGTVDELRKLLPKIEAACGHDAVYSLSRVLH